MVKNDKVKGRMMITLAEIPEGIDVKVNDGKTPRAFEASFAFYGLKVGMALYTDTREAASDIWITPQIDGADPPAQDWIEFFVQKLLESIDEGKIKIIEDSDERAIMRTIQKV